MFLTQVILLDSNNEATLLKALNFISDLWNFVPVCETSDHFKIVRSRNLFSLETLCLVVKPPVWFVPLRIPKKDFGSFVRCVRCTCSLIPAVNSSASSSSFVPLSCCNSCSLTFREIAPSDQIQQKRENIAS